MAIPEWTTACPDWRERIIAGESLIPFKPLFPEQAELALKVFNELCVVDMPPIDTDEGPRSPHLGEVSRRWLIDFVSAWAGSYDADSGRRLIREFFLLIAKKNSKSSSAAGIMLSALILNWRRSGEFTIVAPTKEVADNSFIPARDMVKADPELSDIMHISEHTRTITHRTTNASLKIVAADAESVGGKKSIGTLIDELWLFGKRNNAENMIREATGGMASRPEGFVIYLSTQSDEPPAGVFKQKLRYARSVRDGKISDKRFLPVIYEFPEQMIKSEAYKLPSNFYITNPNLGASVDAEFLERGLTQAEEDGQESVIGFIAKHLNVEIGQGLMGDGWAGALFWEQQKEEGLTLEKLLERCEVVTAGIDGGGLDDMLALAVTGREKSTRRWLHWGHCWLHPVALEYRKKNEPIYRDFEREGDLTIVENVGDDLSQLGDYIDQIEASGKLERIGVDRAGIEPIYEEILSRGLKEDRIIGIPQGWRLVGAIKTAERKLAEGEFFHGGTSLMAWNVQNARVEQKGNAISISKQVSGSAKIDGLLAMFSAVTLLALNPSARKKDYNLVWVK